MIRARSSLFFVSILPLVALAAAGCDKRACFQWTEAEGACPSQEEALVFFENPGCPSSVRSVDGPADFDGEFCCYDVTTVGTNDDDVCVPPPVTSGAGGSSPGTGSVGTGPPPDPGCFLCVDLLFSGVGGPACGETPVLFEQAFTCMCAGPCAESCADNACATPGNFSDPCITCLQDFNTGCGAEFEACLNDSGI